MKGRAGLLGGMKLETKQTDWETELAKEAPEDYVKPILEKMFPYSNIENLREQRIPGKDWIIHINVDDKNDTYLGFTGNISLDEKTTFKLKNVFQLFVNTLLPKGFYIFIDSNKIDFNTVITKCYKIVKRKTKNNNGEEYETKSYVINIKYIKNAVIGCNPCIEWWMREHTRNKIYSLEHYSEVS